MPSMRAQCQQCGTAPLSPSTALCGTRTALWQVHAKPPHTPVALADERCRPTGASGAAPTTLPLPATAALARRELAANASQTEAMAELWERGGTALASCLCTQPALSG